MFISARQRQAPGSLLYRRMHRFDQETAMDILNRITRKIAALPAGEECIISAQELWLSRADFQSVSAFLSRESEKGSFSIAAAEDAPARIGSASLLVTKH